MDDLLDYVRNEIAMDGDDGTPVDRLDTFIQAYYARELDPTTSQISSQNLDASFREFVWRQLIALPEVKVAYLRKTAESAAPIFVTEEGGSTPALTGAAADGGQESPAPMGEEGIAQSLVDQGTYNLKNKAKIKAARKDAGKKARDARITGQEAWEFCELDLEEAQGSSRLQLAEKYGSDRLRVAADPETCFVALTGSHERRSRLTYLTYQILQAITRGREDGKTVVDLGKEFDHDQKSLFHFVKALLELNLIVKIKVMAGRMMTSRCIHRHYLENSEHWAAWQTKDTGGNDVNDGNNDDDDGEYGKPVGLSILTVAHLNSNEPLIRARIIAALKREKEHMIPHLDIVFKIGFLARPQRTHRRRLNRIITSMTTLGVIEKVGVKLPGSKGEQSCIRLVEQPEGTMEEGDDHFLAQAEQDEEEQRPNSLITIPIERQMIDLLIEAGANGLTIREMQAALGDLNNRILETVLSRFERSPNPPHLCDFTLHSVLETFGREKRLRWFTLAGYHERCRLDGLDDLPDMKQFSHPEEAGEFGRLDTLGFYETPAAFHKFALTWNTGAKPGKGGKVQQTKEKAGGAGRGGTTKKAAALRNGVAPKPTGRPRGSTKAAKLEKMFAEGKITKEEYEEQAKKVPKPRTILDKVAQNAGKEGTPEGSDTPKPHPRSKAAKLEKALANGEITQEEYEEQKSKLPKTKPKKAKEAVPDGQTEEGGTPAPTAEGETPKLHPNSKAAKLEKALAEGQITQEEYDEQKAKLPTPKPKKAKEIATGGAGEGNSAAEEGTPKLHPNSKAAKLEKALAASEITQEEYEARKAALPTPKPRKRKATEALEGGSEGSPEPSASSAGGKAAKKARLSTAAPASIHPVLLEQAASTQVQSTSQGTPELEDAADVASGKKRKRTKEPKLGPDGQPLPPPVKGRPRKYPVGTTKQERRALLQERRASGLAPPKKARKSKAGTPGEEEDELESDSANVAPEKSETKANTSVEGDGSSGVMVTDETPGDKRPRRQAAIASAAAVADTYASASKPIADDEEMVASIHTSPGRRSFFETVLNSTNEPSPAGTVVQEPVPEPVIPPKRGPGRPRKKIWPKKKKQVEEEQQNEADAGMDIASIAAAGLDTGATGAETTQEAGDISAAGSVDEVTQAVLDMLAGETQNADQSYASPIGPKRPRGRPRKYVRTGPEPMKPFKYGVYPNFDIYPALREPVQVEERKTRRQLREEQNRRSSTMEVEASSSAQATPQPPTVSIRDQLRKFTQNHQPSPSEQRQLSPSQPLSPRPQASPIVTADSPLPEARHSSNSLPPLPAPAAPLAFVLPDMPAPLPSQGEEDSMQIDFELPPMPLPSTSASAMESAITDPAVMLSRARQHYTDITILPALPVAAKRAAAVKGPERKNYSMHLHEKQYAAALKEAGGITAEGMPFHRIWQEYMQAKNRLDTLPRMLDKRTTSTVMTGLQTRGLVKRSVIQMQGRTGKLVQTPVIYLPEIDLDGRQMRDFIQGLQETPQDLIQGKNWLQGRKTIDKSGDSHFIKAKKSRGNPVIKSEMDARAFFDDEWRIVAQRYGWQFGLVARARTLHEHLAESINDDNDSAFILSSRPEARIFATGYVLKDIPLSVFMCIAATNGNTERLDEFLASHDPTKVLMSQVPRALNDLFPMTGSKTISRFSQLFDVLSSLHVLIPLEQVEQPTDIVAYSGASMEPRYFRARSSKGSNYWMLANESPLYDLSQRNAQERHLIGEYLTRNLEEIKQYWDTIEAVAFGRIETDQLPSAIHTYPPTMVSTTAVTQSVRMQSRWRRSYLLLKTQKMYIRRIVAEQKDPQAFAKDDEAVNQLAYNVWAPLSVIKPYVEAQAVKQSTRVAKKRRAANRGKSRAALEETEDEEEASGSSDTDSLSAAPPPRPKRRQPKSKGKKARSTQRYQDEGEALGEMQASPSPETVAITQNQKKQEVSEILAKKAKHVDSEREKIWDGIYSRFVAEHGVDALGQDQIDFLKSWFMSPGGINAVDLLEHLRTMVADTAITLPPPKPVLGVASRVPAQDNQTRIAGPKPKGPKQVKVAPEAVQQEAEPSEALVDIPDISFIVPEDGPNKTAAGGWTDEEDEQLRDFYVIIQARDFDLGYKFNTDPLKKYYPGVTTKTMLDRLRRFALVNEECPYLDALQEAWTKVWRTARQRGELSDPNPTSITDFDLGKYRSYLCAKINKQSIRFQSMTPAGAGSTGRDLPEDPTELFSSSIVSVKQLLSEQDESWWWDYLYSAITATQKTQKYKYASFTVPTSSLTLPADMTSASRTAVFAERHPYTNLLPASTHTEAASFEKRLLADGEMEWPNVAEDGAMLAVAHLFSDNLLNFKIDTSSTLEGRPYTDYRTRKIDDESFENDLSLGLQEAYKLLPKPLFA